MNNKGYLFLVTLLVFSFSSAQTSLVGSIEDPDEEVVFYHQSYQRSNNITPKGFELVAIRFVFVNDEEEDIQIDFDDLHLIDSQNNLNRVEFIGGKSHDENDKIFLTVKAKSKKKRKVYFIIPNTTTLKGLLYKGTKKIFEGG